MTWNAWSDYEQALEHEKSSYERFEGFHEIEISLLIVSSLLSDALKRLTDASKAPCRPRQRFYSDPSSSGSILIKTLTFQLSSYQRASHRCVGVEFWLNFLLYEENSFLFLAPSTDVEKIPFFSKSHHLCVDWERRERRKTFHHSTTGKTLSNQERLNMIKISSSSPSPCVFSWGKVFPSRKTPKISPNEKGKICRDLRLLGMEII